MRKTIALSMLLVVASVARAEDSITLWDYEKGEITRKIRVDDLPPGAGPPGAGRDSGRWVTFDLLDPTVDPKTKLPRNRRKLSATEDTALESVEAEAQVFAFKDGDDLSQDPCSVAPASDARFELRAVHGLTTRNLKGGATLGKDSTRVAPPFPARSTRRSS